MNRREPDSAEKAFGTDADATIRAARLYYYHGLTQAEIAKQLQVSRPTVANLLARARNRGMVRISLRPDLLGRLSLAEELQAHFGLLNAYVVPTPELVDERTGRKVLALDRATRPKSLAVATAKNA